MIPYCLVFPSSPNLGSCFFVSSHISSFILDFAVFVVTYIQWGVCVCVRNGVSFEGRVRQRSKGYEVGAGVGVGGGSYAPGREAISQLVCSLGSQAENAADLWSKLKWCQCRNKAPC